MNRSEYLNKFSKPFSEWKANFSDPKLEARALVARAVRKKKLNKPSFCSDCGNEFEKKELHGHHNDYSKWWRVEWLCHACHVKRHPEWGLIRKSARIKHGVNGNNQYKRRRRK
jgi:hypothetical protein